MEWPGVTGPVDCFPQSRRNLKYLESQLAGITDDDETQIVQGELKEGDRVIVGLLFDAEGTRKETRSIFSFFFGRR